MRMNSIITTDRWVGEAIGSFHGGFSHRKIKSVHAITHWGIAYSPLLRLPLNQHMGAPALPIVSIGDRVLRGQKIAEAVGGLAQQYMRQVQDCHCDWEYTPPHPSGMSGSCIEITTDGQHESVEFEACDDYRQLTPQACLQKIRDAGITGLAGFPTAIKLQPQDQYTIDTLILNGTECEPYITVIHSLMLYHAEEVINGALLLAHILGEPQQILLGIEDNKPDAINMFRAILNQRTDCDRIKILTFPTKYPSGGEKQLIQLLTGKEVPSGAIPASLGIVMQNVGTAVAAHRAVVKGELPHALPHLWAMHSIPNVMFTHCLAHPWHLFWNSYNLLPAIITSSLWAGR